MFKKILVILCEILFGICSGLLLIELMYRIYQGRLFEYKRYNDQFTARGKQESEWRAAFDPQLGWIPNPGRLRYDGLPYTHLYYPGFPRSSGKKYPKRYESLVGATVLAVGDSYTYGEGVGDLYSWPAYLERSLNYPVINGGVFNYGFDQIYLRAQKLIDIYKPKVTIVSFIPDDLLRCEAAVRLWAKPYYVMSDGQLTLKNVPVPNTIYERQERSKDTFRNIFGYSLVADQILRVYAPDYWLATPIGLVSHQEWARTAEANTAQVTCSLVSRLKELEKKTDVVVIVQYTLADIVGMKEYDRKLLEQTLKCIELENIKVLDLFSSLSQLYQDSPEVFSSLFNGHMTSKGNAFVSKSVEEFLKEKQVWTSSLERREIGF